jgi:hypothetical protein
MIVAIHCMYILSLGSAACGGGFETSPIRFHRARGEGAVHIYNTFFMYQPRRHAHELPCPPPSPAPSPSLDLMAFLSTPYGAMHRYGRLDGRSPVCTGEDCDEVSREEWTEDDDDEASAFGPDDRNTYRSAP